MNFSLDSEETLESLASDKFLEKIKEKAISDGKNGIPTATDNVGYIESHVKLKISNIIKNIVDETSTLLRISTNVITNNSLQSKENVFDQQFEEFNREVIKKWELDYETEIKVAEKEAKLAYEEYVTFKKEKNLVDPPIVIEWKQRLLDWALLCGMVFFEAIINMSFYKDVSNGLIGGMVIAAAISILNIGICWSFGRFLICKLRCKTDLKQMVIGAAFLVVALVLGLIIAMFTAHYRDDLQTVSVMSFDVLLSFVDPVKWINNLFEVNAWYIALLTAFLGLLAGREGYFWTEPNPGYLAVFKKRKKYIEDFLYLQQEANTYLNNEKEEKLNELEKKMYEIRNNFKNVSYEVNRRESLEKTFRSNIDMAKNVYCALVKEYQSTNRSARAPNKINDIPESFKREPSLDDLDIMNPNIWPSFNLTADKEEYQKQKLLFDSLEKKFQDVKTSINQACTAKLKPFQKLEVI